MKNVSYKSRLYSRLAITKLDVLDQLDELKIAIGYKHNGDVLESYPASMEVLESVEVEYVSLPGWKCSVKECRSFQTLPKNALDYLNFVEKFLGVPSKIYLLITLKTLLAKSVFIFYSIKSKS